MPSNDWTQTPPPVPDGMPEGTEWWPVSLWSDCLWAAQNKTHKLFWHELPARGLTALAFAMPDGTDENPSWHVEWDCLKPVQWNYKTAQGYYRWETHTSPGPASNDYIVSARWALKVPPRVYGGDHAEPDK